MYDVRKVELGGLGCRVAAVQGSERPKLAVVLCHGYGAPADDLVPLAAELGRELHADVAREIRFYFPEAPEAALGIGFGRAWWQLERELLERLQLGIRPEPALRRAHVPEGLRGARRRLHALVDELARTSSLPFERVVLGGFSQGAMLTTDLALRMEEAPAGLVVLSGTLVAEPEWTPRMAARAGLRVFASHGRQDPLLGFDDAEALVSRLRDAGCDARFHPFSGGHEIPLVVLDALAAFLAELAVA